MGGTDADHLEKSKYRAQISQTNPRTITCQFSKIVPTGPFGVRIDPSGPQSPEESESGLKNLRQKSKTREVTDYFFMGGQDHGSCRQLEKCMLACFWLVLACFGSFSIKSQIHERFFSFH